MTDLIIRGYRESDLPQIQRIARTAWKLDRFHVDPKLKFEDADAFWEKIITVWCQQGESKTFVAERKEVIVGYITFMEDKELSKRFAMKYGTILMVGVDVLEQGEGVGRKLVQKIVKWCKKSEFKKVDARTDVSNIPAIRAYMREGFTISHLTVRFTIDFYNSSHSSNVSHNLRGKQMSNITIRRYQKSDLSQIQRITRTAWKQDMYHVDPKLKSEDVDAFWEQFTIKRCNDRSSEVLVATNRGTVIGFVIITKDKDLTKQFKIKAGEIPLLRVDHQHRNEGVEKELLERAVDWLKEKGFEKTSSKVDVSDISAIQAFGRAGFGVIHFSMRLTLDL